MPVSWATGLRSAPVQRRGRYRPASTQHPARMLPAIAAHAISVYTSPGDLVLDPMCGIPTTLVEATHLGRDAIGVELEGRWVDLAAGNLRLARTQGAVGAGTVIRGDATTLPELVPAALRGKVALVVTSPPYGPTVHGLVRPGPDGVHKHARTYSDQPDRRNLAHRNWTGLVDGFTKILEGCRALLRPGGTVVVTARPWRKNGHLVDLPTAVITAGINAGLQPVERCVALLAAVRGGRLVARPSFFQLQRIRKARTDTCHTASCAAGRPTTPRCRPALSARTRWVAGCPVCDSVMLRLVRGRPAPGWTCTGPACCGSGCHRCRREPVPSTWRTAAGASGAWLAERSEAARPEAPTSEVNWCRAGTMEAWPAGSPARS